MDNKALLTILTPSYNRGELLKNCYLSLKNQTQSRFQWIIADDGSTDCTEQIVAQFAAQSPDMDIQYIKKTNGGKHTALNASHPYIKGDYVLILDSDDTLTETAVAEVYQQWARFEAQQEVAIVTFLKGYSVDDPNAYAQQEGVPVDILRHKRVIIHANDCCEVIRTELFKKYPFPVFENEKFLSEGVLWNQVGFHKKCVYINRVIYLCEYLDGGLTKSGKSLRIRNPQGGMLSSYLNMNRRNLFFSRIKAGLLHVCYGFFAGLSVKKIMTKYPEYLWIKVCCLLPGYMIYRIWKKKYMD